MRSASSDRRDKKYGFPGPGVDIEELSLQRLACPCIERAEWFIHQQNLGIDGKRACNADALFHATGKLVRSPILRVLETHKVKILFGRLA